MSICWIYNNKIVNLPSHSVFSFDITFIKIFLLYVTCNILIIIERQICSVFLSVLKLLKYGVYNLKI